jgi:hypothetical protein
LRSAGFALKGSLETRHFAGGKSGYRSLSAVKQAKTGQNRGVLFTDEYIGLIPKLFNPLTLLEI